MIIFTSFQRSPLIYCVATTDLYLEDGWIHFDFMWVLTISMDLITGGITRRDVIGIKGSTEAVVKA